MNNMVPSPVGAESPFQMLCVSGSLGWVKGYRNQAASANTNASLSSYCTFSEWAWGRGSETKFTDCTSDLFK